ncbi:hypothetical protein ACTOJ1_001164 [Shigella flexneri]
MKKFFDENIFPIFMLISTTVMVLFVCVVGISKGGNITMENISLYIPLSILASLLFFGGFNCIIKNKWLDESPYDNKVYKSLINQAENRLKYMEKHLSLNDLYKVAKELKSNNQKIEYVYILSAVVYEQEKRVRNTLPKEIKKWIRKHPREMAAISYA